MRFFKWLFGLVFLLVVLVVVAVIVLPMVVDPNDYRDEIAAQVKKQTGRDLIIEDPMKLSVFPWLGLELGKVQLGNAPGFGDAPFAAIDELKLKVKLRPLIDKRIEVDTVVLDGLALNLTRNKAGKTNWGDLQKEAKPTGKDKDVAKSSKPGDVAIDIQGIELQNARIVWDDQQTGSGYTLSDVSLVTGQLEAGKAIPVKAGMKISSTAPRMDMEIGASGDVQVNESRERFQVAGFSVSLDAEGEGLPASGLSIKAGMDMVFDAVADTLQIDKLNVQGPQIEITGSLNGSGLSASPAINGELQLQETRLKSLLALMGVVVETTDPTALTSASGKLSLAATDNSISLDPLEIRLDGSSLKGKLAVTSFDGPTIRADLSLDDIDLDRYLPPGQESAAADPAAAVTAGAASTPADNFAALRSLDLNAKFHIGRLKAFNIFMQDTNITMVSRNGVLRIDPLTSNLYEGKVKGAYKLDVTGDKPQLHLKENLSGVQVGPLLSDFADFDKLLGTGDISADVRMTGLSEQEIRNSLNGDLAFSFKDGAYKGINVAQVIRDAQGMLSGKTYPADKDPKTDFSELSATAKITNGVVVNKDLKAQSPLLRINGEGKVNLPKDKIDYTLTTKVVGSLEGQGGTVGKELEGVAIPVRLKGDLKNPKPSVDPQALAQALAGSKLDVQKDKVKEKLDKKLKEKGLDNMLKGMF
ncbi:MAG: AsmA family protein [bacterium]